MKLTMRQLGKTSPPEYYWRQWKALEKEGSVDFQQILTEQGVLSATYALKANRRLSALFGAWVCRLYWESLPREVQWEVRKIELGLEPAELPWLPRGAIGVLPHGGYVAAMLAIEDGFDLKEELQLLGEDPMKWALARRDYAKKF